MTKSEMRTEIWFDLLLYFFFLCWNECFFTHTDLTNQALQTTSNFIVHPCSLYVGISTKKSYGKPKEIIPFDVIVCNIDGEPVEGVEIEVNSILSWTEPVESIDSLSLSLSLLIFLNF
jgi:hypothetical protein